MLLLVFAATAYLVWAYCYTGAEVVSLMAIFWRERLGIFGLPAPLILFAFLFVIAPLSAPSILLVNKVLPEE